MPTPDAEGRATHSLADNKRLKRLSHVLVFVCFLLWFFVVCFVWGGVVVFFFVFVGCGVVCVGLGGVWFFVGVFICWIIGLGG